MSGSYYILNYREAEISVRTHRTHTHTITWMQQSDPASDSLPAVVRDDVIHSDLFGLHHYNGCRCVYVCLYVCMCVCEHDRAIQNAQSGSYRIYHADLSRHLQAAPVTLPSLFWPTRYKPEVSLVGEGGAKEFLVRNFLRRQLLKRKKEVVSRLPGGEILIERRALRGGWGRVLLPLMFITW